MANISIGDLPELITLSGAELVPILNGNTTQMTKASAFEEIFIPQHITHSLTANNANNAFGVKTLSASDEIVANNLSVTGKILGDTFLGVSDTGQSILAVDDSTDRVGINKNEPSATLHVVNNNAAGGGYGEALRVIGATLLTTSADTALTITSSDDGTDDEPLVKLRRGALSAQEGLFGIVSESNNALSKFTGALPNAIYIQSQNTKTDGFSAENIQLAVNEKIGLTVKGSNTKDVKIGVGTEDPTEKLHVAERGQSAFILLSSYAEDDTQGIKFGQAVTSTLANSSIGELDFIDSSNSTEKLVAQIVSHGTGARELTAVNLSGGGELVFSTKPLSGELTEVLKITDAGKVGIGTIKPNQTLTVIGDISATGSVTIGSLSSQLIKGDLTVDSDTLKVDSANNRVGIRVASPVRPFHIKTSTTDDEGQHPLRVEGASSSIIEIKAGDDTSFTGIDFGDNSDLHPGSIVYNHRINSMIFDTSNSTRMTITSSGAIGIGEINPEFKLTVNDDLMLSGASPLLNIDDKDSDIKFARSTFTNESGSLKIQTRTGREFDGTQSNKFISNDYVLNKNLSGAYEHNWVINNNVGVNRSSMKFTSGGLFIQNNQEEPATPTAGGTFFVSAGELKFKGSSGTVTTIASA